MTGPGHVADPALVPTPALAVALDVPELEDAVDLARRLRSVVDVCKVGLELLTRYGPTAVEAVREAGGGLPVFADFKLHDIPRTVQAACENLAAVGVSYMTVHLGGGPSMLRAALEGAAAGADKYGMPRANILGVSVLTSLDAAELAATGIDRAPVELVAERAGLASEVGIDGLVCAPVDLETVRSVARDLLLVTPGVRPAVEGPNGPYVQLGRVAAVTGDDQRRVATPRTALDSGADLLVVGRPIVSAPDPLGAATALHEEVVARRTPGR